MAQLRAVLTSLFTGHHKISDSEELRESQDFHTKFKEAFKRGTFDEVINKAEIDYAEGRALTTLY